MIRCSGVERWAAAITVLAAAMPAGAVGPASHGAGIAKWCDEARAVGDTLECHIYVTYNDDFGDTMAVIEAWDVIDPWPGGENIRVPEVGNLQIIDAWGNTTAVPGGSLPVLMGPAGSTLNGLPGTDEPGVVVFVQDTYVIQQSDRDPLFDQCHVIVEDLCDAEASEGCYRFPNELQFTAAADIIHPAVAGALAETPPPVCAGQSTDVTWEVLVSVPPEGDVPLVNLALEGGPCGAAVRMLPDAAGNDDDVLEPGEVWRYTCSASVDGDVDETVFVFAEDAVAGYFVSDSLSVTVEAVEPPVATIEDPGAICVGETIVLAGGPAGMASYQWTGPGGFTSSEQSPVAPALPGTYCLTVVDPLGCAATECLSPAVHEPPAALIALGPTPVCTTPGNVASVQVSGGQPPYAFTWTIAGGGWTITDGASGSQVTYTAGGESTGGLHVAVTDDNGCLTDAFLWVDCTTPTGGCCLDDAACAQLTEAECADAGGVYSGDFSACAADPCAPPDGACCLSFGPCAVTDPQTCAAAGGTYLGDGAACDPGTCPEPVGACCMTGGCEVLTADQCTGAGGTWDGAGACAQSDCPPPIGACCLPSGECVQVDEVACLAGGGIYREDGSTCAAEACLGACCFDDGSCQSMTATACGGAGGVYGGPDLTCPAAACPAPGACCYDDGSCSFLLPIACALSGGSFQAEDMPCGDNVCIAAIVSCCEDEDPPRSLTVQYTAESCGDSANDQGPGATCAGTVTLPSEVRIRCSDQPPPLPASAPIWFEGVVETGDQFMIDALREDREALSDRTWIIIEDLSGQQLQAVSIDTTCALPLRVGDRYGAIRIEDCAGWIIGPDDPSGGPDGGCPGAEWLEPLVLPQWPEPFRPETPFGAVFSDVLPGLSLLDVAAGGGSDLMNAGSAAVLALLDAAHPDVVYEHSVGDVVSLFDDTIEGGDPFELQRIDDDMGRGCGGSISRSVFDGNPLCPADVDASGVVDEADLVSILQAWGPCDGDCAADVDGNGVVDAEDMVAAVLGWGGCP